MNTATHRRPRLRGSRFDRQSGRGRRQHGGRPEHRGHGGRNGRRGRVMPTFDPSKFINTNPVEASVETYEPKHRFGDFGLNGKLVHTIASLGMATPSPIQDQVIPLILEGRDVVGLAETGTGKTAAFLVPLIEKTIKEYKRQTLILAPTRELAIQIEAELHRLAHGFRVYGTTCVGGMSIGPQIRALRRTNHFIIGTPGRVLDLVNRGNLDLRKVTTVVLDEADRMLDMGFIHDIREIVGKTPKTRETLFFSATIDPNAEKLVAEFLREPVTVSVKKRDVTSSIEQDVVRFDDRSKFETLVSLLAAPAFTRVIIFGSMKHSVEKLAKQLSAAGVAAESIHGNKTHGQRQRALSRFKEGHARVLVATDVAARGIHVDDVSHVVNYDLPNTFEDYVHRIGRTGRGTKRGKALTFVPNRA